MGLGWVVRIPCRQVKQHRYPDSEHDIFEDALEDAFEIEIKPNDSLERTIASARLLCLEKANEIFEECINWYREGHILKAYNNLISIQEEVIDIKKFMMVWGDQVEKIKLRMEQLAEALHSATVDEEHYLMAHESEPKILYRHIPGTRVHSLKFEGEYDFASEEVYAMGREFNYLDTWNPYARESSILKDEDDLCMVVYTGLWLPWPFNEREMIVQCQGADLIDERGCYLVTFQDYNGEDTSLQVREKKKRERVSVLPGSGVVLYPCDSSNASKTRVVLTTHVDPILMAPPNWLVNFFLKLMAPTLHRALKKALYRAYVSDSNSPYARMLKERNLYRKMKTRKSMEIEDVFPN